ncbi:type IV pilus secretin PilQ [Paraburkholderia megapolitana]|uniref:Type IV pilus assembly protein PilQ n=1 Tax=Paraburkholderia megapolitana TaxID=420953 RepID=A0A1I3V8D5_9BURK|nr:type IV pilus secretin PilQ [Paraburkholderia megapolitana]SFJ91555.1 type IV pilus assembly protein PilQ [Paraburkholderia megapolitana]
MSVICKTRYVALYVLIITSVMVPAARASLPPLPEHMPLDDTIVPFGVPPLPRDAIGEVANPSQLDGAERAAANGGGSGDIGSREARSGEIDSPATPRSEAVHSGAARDVLEGPPVPLPRAQRIATDAATDTDEPGSGVPPDRPITMHFQKAELGAVLDAFARFTGLNIVSSDQVRGTVSLRLDKVRWRDAFDTLLDVNGLAMERRGNVIWVAPLAQLATRERQRFETHARTADLEPLASRVFELRYARADEVRRLLSASGNQRVLSKRGAVMADARTNLLFVTDLEARLAQIADVIAMIDRPTRQVLIEARIVEGERGFSRNLGARMLLANTHESGSGMGVVGGSEGKVVDLSARPLSGFDAATAGLTLFAAQATRLLNIELSALEAEGHGETVSSPRVVTADRTKAIVEQGTELPYQAKVGQGVSGVQFRRAGLKLEVEPQITPDGRVVLDLDVAKDSVGEQTAAGPAINTKHVQTRVEVEDGGTVSIGGIYEQDERDDVTRVPLLGKIPVLGALFRHRAHRQRNGELVVFITPRVVHAP